HTIHPYCRYTGIHNMCEGRRVTGCTCIMDSGSLTSLNNDPMAVCPTLPASVHKAAGWLSQRTGDPTAVATARKAFDLSLLRRSAGGIVRPPRVRPARCFQPLAAQQAPSHAIPASLLEDIPKEANLCGCADIRRSRAGHAATDRKT